MSEPTPEELIDRLAQGIVVSVDRRRQRAMIEVRSDDAETLLGPLASAAGSEVADATRAELENLRKRAPNLEDSALAATALQLARELDNPFNSATSKSQCARSLLDIFDRLNELAPEAPKEPSKLDQIAERAAAAIGGKAAES